MRDSQKWLSASILRAGHQKQQLSWEQKFGKKPTDNIFNSRALFFLLESEGFREEADGGRLIEFGLTYAENYTSTGAIVA